VEADFMKEYKINHTQEKLIKLLKQNARFTDAELSAMLSIPENQVAGEIEKLEANGVIRQYTAVINEDALEGGSVTAVVEVKVTPKAKFGYKSIAKTIAGLEQVESVYLMSGNYDFSITVKCDNLREVSYFVAEQLSPIDGILSTTTHFIIGYYKEFGVESDYDDRDERGFVSP
jgi:DNA-binding Lrp family transcriptional regulator